MSHGNKIKGIIVWWFIGYSNTLGENEVSDEGNVLDTSGVTWMEDKEWQENAKSAYSIEKANYVEYHIFTRRYTLKYYSSF